MVQGGPAVVQLALCSNKIRPSVAPIFARLEAEAFKSEEGVEESVCGERVDGLQMDGSGGPAGEERHPPLVFRSALLDQIRTEEVDAGAGEGRLTKTEAK